MRAAIDVALVRKPDPRTNCIRVEILEFKLERRLGQRAVVHGVHLLGLRALALLEIVAHRTSDDEIYCRRCGKGSDDHPLRRRLVNATG